MLAMNRPICQHCCRLPCSNSYQLFIVSLEHGDGVANSWQPAFSAAHSKECMPLYSASYTKYTRLQWCRLNSSIALIELEIVERTNSQRRAITHKQTYTHTYTTHNTREYYIKAKVTENRLTLHKWKNTASHSQIYTYIYT